MHPPHAFPAAALRDLARGGIAVASSIHAPSPDTFALFDRVLILQRGRAVNFGDNGGLKNSRVVCCRRNCILGLLCWDAPDAIQSA